MPVAGTYGLSAHTEATSNRVGIYTMQIYGCAQIRYAPQSTVTAGVQSWQGLPSGHSETLRNMNPRLWYSYSLSHHNKRPVFKAITFPCKTQ